MLGKPTIATASEASLRSAVIARSNRDLGERRAEVAGEQLDGGVEEGLPQRRPQGFRGHGACLSVAEPRFKCRPHEIIMSQGLGSAAVSRRPLPTI